VGQTHTAASSIRAIRPHRGGSGYLLGLLGGAGAAVPRVARFERAGRGSVQDAGDGLAAVQRGRAHLGVHRGDVEGKAVHGEEGRGGVHHELGLMAKCAALRRAIQTTGYPRTAITRDQLASHFETLLKSGLI